MVHANALLFAAGNTLSLASEYCMAAALGLLCSCGCKVKNRKVITHMRGGGGAGTRHGGRRAQETLRAGSRPKGPGGRRMVVKGRSSWG